MQALIDSKKKILAVSFEGARPAQAIAAWTGESLMILELRECTIDPWLWLQELIQDMNRKKGWAIMVDDRTKSFPAPATSFDFNAYAWDGRTNMQACLDWYFTLQSRGALVFDSGTLRWQMRAGGANDLVVAKSDEAGRLKYEVNWLDFTAAHRAILLAVAAACMEEPLSDRWVNIFGDVPAKKQELPIWPVFRVMNDWQRTRQEEFEAEVEAHNSYRSMEPPCMP